MDVQELGSAFFWNLPISVAALSVFQMGKSDATMRNSDVQAGTQWFPSHTSLSVALFKIDFLKDVLEEIILLPAFPKTMSTRDVRKGP